MNISEHALNYAKHGWPVFPLNGKIPFESTKGHLDATTDTETVKKMWQKYPNANIGFAVPANIVVLDVDIKPHEGKYGDETLASLTDKHGALPDTVESITGGGGRQLFFKTDKAVTCSNGFLPSIDRKSKGGYVVLPPSVHPETGVIYEWEATNPPFETELAPLPDWLYGLMTEKKSQEAKELPQQIRQGERNETLFKLACSLRGKGLTEAGIQAAIWQENLARCTPPLAERDIRTIAESSAKYPAGTISNRKAPTGSVKPTDFTDTANARIFAREYRGQAIFTTTHGWLIWNGKKWEENDLKAADLAMKLTDKMLDEAREQVKAAGNALTEAKLAEDKEAKDRATKFEKAAEAYRKHALSSRQKNKIAAMLFLAQSLLAIPSEKLDADPYTLNTPAGIVDLRTGSIFPHDPAKLCTKITKCSPSTKGMDMWQEHLHMVSCGDEKLEGFLQQVAGMTAIGCVFEENLIIGIGDGKNGKSAHFNSQALVMHDYAGTLAAETLTTSNKSRGAELATLKGKRLVIAAETDEGARLSTSMLKQLTSTDKIRAERKYRDPEDFIPSHTAVLYTNHFPRVGSTDTGTWRRIVPIPFDAKIPPEKEVKNYANVLTEKAGEAIMAWVIQGAVNFYALGHKLIKPEAVELLVEEYKAQNDWLTEFMDEFCEVEHGQSVKAGLLYETYYNWAKQAHGYARKSDAFNAEMEKRGFEKRKTMYGAMWYGLCLRFGTQNNHNFCG